MSHLPQRHIAGIGEAVRCAGGNDDDVARVHLTLFLANVAGGIAFLHQDQFIIVYADEASRIDPVTQ